MAGIKNLSLDDLCKFMGSHGGTLTIEKPREADGRKRQYGTHVRLTINPDGYRQVAVARLVQDDGLWSRPEVDFFARELECMVRQLERENPSLPASLVSAV